MSHPSYSLSLFLGKVTFQLTSVCLMLAYSFAEICGVCMCFYFQRATYFPILTYLLNGIILQNPEVKVFQIFKVFQR